MYNTAKVLFVDDQVDLYKSDVLRHAGTGFVVTFSDQGTEAIERAKEVDVLVLDLEYPGQENEIASRLGFTESLSGPESGIGILQYYQKHFPDVGVIIVTQSPSEQAIGRCFQLGAIQYLDKDRKGGLDCFQLVQEVRNAVELVHARKAKRLFENTGDAGEEFISRSPAVREILKEAAKLARQKISILLLGESGVGKERLARFIHRYSDRAQKPFVSVNVGALQQELLGSELFGHLKGSFTGANADKPGLFHAAHRGTIFLDEIGEAGADVQVGLLRVLQDGEVRRVGATRAEAVDVRVIAATNRDLGELVSSGEFRDDLYFRLAKATLTLPPLRSRPEDIPVLSSHFIEKFCKANGQPLKELSGSALEALRGYAWPGNVRELEGVVEHTIALTAGITIGVDDLSLPASKQLGKWSAAVDELAVELVNSDETARRFMNDLDILVYDRLYQKLGTHGKVAVLWGKEEEAMTAQRQRWAESLAKDILAGRRKEDDIPTFLKKVCEKYLKNMRK